MSVSPITRIMIFQQSSCSGLRGCNPQPTPIIPAALLRGYLKSSEAGGNTAPNNDISVRPKKIRGSFCEVRWWWGQEKVSPKSAGFFFFKVPVWNWIFFWGGCFYFFCDDVWIFQSNFCGINDESRYVLWSCWWIDVAPWTLWISGCFLTKIGVHV